MTHPPGSAVSLRHAIASIIVIWRVVISLFAAVFAADSARAEVDLEMFLVYMPESNISPNRQAVAGNEVSAAFILRNIGTTTAAESYCEVRLTKSPVSSGSAADVVDVVSTGYALEPGDSVGGGVIFRAPSEPGTYYIWIIADAKKQFTQSNTANDAGVSESLTVHAPNTVPNFTVDSLVIDKKSASPGGEITASWKLVNDGGGAAPATKTTVRFSDDAKDNTGEPGGEVSSPALAPGASFDQSIKIKVPDDFKIGKGYVWLEVAETIWPRPLETNPYDNERRSAPVKIVAPVLPVITGINPKSVLPSMYSVPVTIAGKNFQEGVTLLFDPPSGPDIPGNPLKLTYRSVKSLEYAFNNAEDTGTWVVRAKNPDGRISAPFSFEVKGSEGPVIDEVTPDPVLPSVALQTITIEGSGFQKGASLLFDPPNGGVIKGKAARIVSLTATQIVYQLNNGADAGPWTVQVKNPKGGTSQPRTFHVGGGSPPTAPGNKATLVEAVRMARGTLSAEQELCVNLVFDAFQTYGDGDINKLLYMLATIWHESDFKPIPEWRADPVTNPDRYQDQEAYWHTGYYGRGYLQLTHDYNYILYGRLIGVDLYGNPEWALIPEHAAKIAVLGMMRGFTNKPLNDYINASFQRYLEARSSVNGYVESQANDVASKNTAIRAALASMQAASSLAMHETVAPAAMSAVQPASPKLSLRLVGRDEAGLCFRVQGAAGSPVVIQQSQDLIGWENCGGCVLSSGDEVEVRVGPLESGMDRGFFRAVVPE